MEWSHSEENYNRKSNAARIRKSVSTSNFNTVMSNLTLREARSFTGALEELRTCSKSPDLSQTEQNVTRLNEIHKETQGAENGYITKEVMSNQVYLVKNEMLTYRGRKYSLNDIATRWKKDCRMWLWKNKLCKKKNRSLGEIRDKIQNLKLPNRAM